MKVMMLGNAASRHVHRWSRWAAERGHEVMLCSDTAPREEMDYSGIRIIRPNWTFFRNLVTFKLRGGPYANNRDKWRVYAEEINRAKPDLLHAHDAIGYGPMLAHFPQYARVLTPWGRDVEETTGAEPERDALVRQGASAANIISTNAPGIEERWSRILQVEPTKFQCFSWGINTSIFYTRPEEEQRVLRKRLNIDPDVEILLSPRFAKPIYALEVLVAAWRQLPDKGDRQFVILRAGGQEDYWREIGSLATGDTSIRMLDEYLSPEEMAALYSTSSAVVMIPETDLLAMSLLEAIGCGASPIVCENPCYRSALVDIDEHAQERAKGIYLSARTPEAVLAGLRCWINLSREDAASIAQHNIEYVRAFQRWQDCADRMQQVYEVALA